MVWSRPYSHNPHNPSLLVMALGTRHPLLLFFQAAQRRGTSSSPFIDEKTGAHLKIKLPVFWQVSGKDISNRDMLDSQVHVFAFMPSVQNKIFTNSSRST